MRNYFWSVFIIFSFHFFCYSQAIDKRKCFLNSKKISDTITENKIVLIPVKNSAIYNFGKVIYSGNLDTLIKEISKSHEVRMPKKSWKINGQSIYWKIITHPYWYYGGQCLFISVKKIKNSKWEIEMRMNYACRKPNYSWRIRTPFHLKYYQEIVDQAIKKSPK